MPNSIPYDDLKLREAYREGRRVWARGELLQTEFRREDIEEALRQGYEDTQEQEPRG